MSKTMSKSVRRMLTVKGMVVEEALKLAQDAVSPGEHLIVSIDGGATFDWRGKASQWDILLTWGVRAGVSIETPDLASVLCERGGWIEILKPPVSEALHSIKHKWRQVALMRVDDCVAYGVMSREIEEEAGV